MPGIVGTWIEGRQLTCLNFISAFHWEIFVYLIDNCSQNFNCVPNLTASMSVTFFSLPGNHNSGSSKPRTRHRTSTGKAPTIKRYVSLLYKGQFEVYLLQDTYYYDQLHIHGYTNPIWWCQSDLNSGLFLYMLKWIVFELSEEGMWPQRLIKSAKQQPSFLITYLNLILVILHLECHPGLDLKASHL